jgi:peptide-methionine (S)-S-oxide reductase
VAGRSFFSPVRKDAAAAATNEAVTPTRGPAAMPTQPIPPAQIPAGKDVATLGGGCFWCLEAVFDDLVGVESVESGYMGGRNSAPTYEQVCGGGTGHAEVVRVTFDPKAIAYRDILDVFFAIHDPTTLNRQGNDVGTQYRSAIFYHSPEQKKVAEEAIASLRAEKVYDDPIVTEVAAASDFWVAERYHQEYFKNNPYQPYCMWVVAPKVQKFRKTFLAKAKKA